MLQVLFYFDPGVDGIDELVLTGAWKKEGLFLELDYLVGVRIEIFGLVE